jgi:hypothetical protein
MTPTQRALTLARKLGWQVAIVEKWNPHAKIRQDLFGVFDLLAVGNGKITGIQVSSGSNHAARVRKIREWAGLEDWLKAGGHAEVWTWSKKGPRGKAKVWTLRNESVTLQSGASHQSAS